MGNVFKCLIVDDEKPAHLVLQSHISKCDDLVYSASAYNGKEALKMLIEQTFDFVFLDIEMPLINGLEVMQTLSKRPATIVTTAYNNFAFDAYQEDAVDYLLKPISFPRFQKSIDKAKYFWHANQLLEPLKTSITLLIEGRNKEIQLDNILYFESIGNYLKVFFVEGSLKSVVVYDTLKNIINSTPSTFFIQTHKSYIVNINQIDSLNKEKVILSEGINIPLGRKYELMVANATRNTTKNTTKNP
jgi:two-component system, LytTR family, response regulator